MNKKERLKFIKAAITILDSLKLKNLSTSFQYYTDKPFYMFIFDNICSDNGKLITFWAEDTLEANKGKFNDAVSKLKTDNFDSFREEA